MSVDEIIAQLPALDAAARQRLRAALDAAEQPELLAAREAAEAAATETDEERWQRGEAILDELCRGLVSGGGKHLSVGIDEALYGGES
ncbi:MAG: hypothetical protein IT204_16620 [Fimbriimonadaceae bacterium]|nr:hypothetical protein [Fimbriimonadaceae bacterium]